MTGAFFSFSKQGTWTALFCAGVAFSGVAVWATFGGFSRSEGPASPANRTEILRSTIPLVVAIRRYETDQGRPPTTLADLVPRYLPRIPVPPPAICSGQHYLYAVESKQWRVGVPVRGERDGVLTYSSAADYPPGKPGISVERIGDWAYYHGNPF